jgi:hypothetical protein
MHLGVLTTFGFFSPLSRGVLISATNQDDYYSRHRKRLLCHSGGTLRRSGCTM